jgi:SAM-dependent methyltransferase
MLAPPIANAATPKCVACESNDLHIVRGIRDAHAATQEKYDLYACFSCGSASLLSPLNDGILERLYPPHYYSYASTPPTSKAHEFLRRLTALTYQRHRFKPQFTRLLEVGSGAGQFLAQIRTGGDVIGLERSASAASAARGLGVEVRVGDVNDDRLFPAGSFDYVYLNHSFEHLTNPVEALRSIRKWLCASGRLFIGVPNIGGLVARTFGRHWYHLCPPLHLTNFTPTGIRAILERNGFKVERIAYNSDPFSIPMSLYVAMGGDVGRMGFGAKALTRGIAMLAFPFSRSLDWLRLGDCMEVHARRVD